MTTIEALVSSDDGQPGERFCSCGEPLEVVLETFPEWVRSAHEKARNRGIWPHNGAQRTSSCRSCAELAVECDPEWTAIVELDAQ